MSATAAVGNAVRVQKSAVGKTVRVQKSAVGKTVRVQKSAAGNAVRVQKSAAVGKTAQAQKSAAGKTAQAQKSAAGNTAQPRRPITTSPARPAARRLKVIPKAAPRFRKLYFVSFVAALVALVAIPFAIVVLHASLLTGQRELNDTRLELNQQLELRQQLLFERSQAVSPEHIQTTATEVLGMVTAEDIVYLQPLDSGSNAP